MNTAITEWNALLNRPDVVLFVSGREAEPVRREDDASGSTLFFPHGLAAVGVKTVFENAVEWAWRLENRSEEPAPPVTAFRPLLLSLPCSGCQAPALHGSRGGLDEAQFPPESWTAWRKSIVSEGLAWGFRANSAGGRSSNRDVPFFVLEEKAGDRGYFLALGWSGDWDLFMGRSGEIVSVHAGMSQLNLSLRHGESFRQPTVLTGRYTGDAAAGQRTLRRHLRDRVQPSRGGRRPAPLAFMDHYFGDGGNLSEADALAEIPAAAKAGFDYFVLDGGWTGGGEDGRFQSLIPHIGSWRPDPVKYPRGLTAVREAAARNGIQLGLWFDLERAAPESEAGRNHASLFYPDWQQGGCMLLRLSDPAALDWAVETVSQAVREAGAGWIRFDMNADPGGCWARQDVVGRRGATEIRYIENLYALLDSIRARFPDLVIENCASGGRRIDLEMIRRTHADWISDHTQAESVVRYHIQGAARWLPANRIDTSMAHAFHEPHRPVAWGQPLPAAAYLSLFGGNFSISDRLMTRTPAGRDAVRDFLRLFRDTAPCFAGETLFVGRQEESQNGPVGLAAHDPQTGKRAVVLFGVPPGEAAARLPPGFADLVAEAPRAGDAGTDQFVCAYLWYD